MGGFSGCLIRLLLLPLIIGAIYPLLGLPLPLSGIVFPLKAADAAAIVAGLSLWLIPLSFLDIRHFTSDLAMLNKGILKDGARIIVSGPITPQAPLLTAPFSKEECVAYKYTARCRPCGAAQSQWTCYEGYALIPALIKSPLGKIKILAEPNLELFYELPMTDIVDEAKEQAKNYLHSCSFGKEVKGPGNFRVDKKLSKRNDLEDFLFEFKESVIQPDNSVMLSGIYSSEQGGLKDPDNILIPYHIVPDGESILRKKLRNRILTIKVCLGLSASVIATYFFWFS